MSDKWNNPLIKKIYPNLTHLVRKQKSQKKIRNIKIVKQVLRNASTLQLFQISGCRTRPRQNHHHMSDLRLVVLEERGVDAEWHHGNTILTKSLVVKIPWDWLRFHVDVLNTVIQYMFAKRSIFSTSNHANARLYIPNFLPSPYKVLGFIAK